MLNVKEGDLVVYEVANEDVVVRSMSVIEKICENGRVQVYNAIYSYKNVDDEWYSMLDHGNPPFIEDLKFAVRLAQIEDFEIFSEYFGENCMKKRSEYFEPVS